jgi:hypothetical protein
MTTGAFTSSILIVCSAFLAACESPSGPPEHMQPGKARPANISGTWSGRCWEPTFEAGRDTYDWAGGEVVMQLTQEGRSVYGTRVHQASYRGNVHGTGVSRVSCEGDVYGSYNPDSGLMHLFLENTGVAVVYRFIDDSAMVGGMYGREHLERAGGPAPQHEEE